MVPSWTAELMTALSLVPLEVSDEELTCMLPPSGSTTGVLALLSSDAPDSCYRSLERQLRRHGYDVAEARRSASGAALVLFEHKGADHGSPRATTVIVSSVESLPAAASLAGLRSGLERGQTLVLAAFA